MIGMCLGCILLLSDIPTNAHALISKTEQTGIPEEKIDHIHRTCDVSQPRFGTGNVLVTSLARVYLHLQRSEPSITPDVFPIVFARQLLVQVK